MGILRVVFEERVGPISGRSPNSFISSKGARRPAVQYRLDEVFWARRAPVLEIGCASHRAHFLLFPPFCFSRSRSLSDITRISIFLPLVFLLTKGDCPVDSFSSLALSSRF